MHNGNNILTFRPAAKADVAAISRINRQHWRKFDNPRGFLLKQISDEQVMAQLDQFWVVEINNDVAAYIELASIFTDYETYCWFDSMELNWITGVLDGVMRISQLGVDPAYQQSGAGSFAIAKLREQFPQAVFITALICKPSLNQASLAFHKKNQFRPVAFTVEGEFEKLIFLNP
ncbi:MAG: N-acetyltransferase family protein [Candidatus Saccharibacteria bacterium]